MGNNMNAKSILVSLVVCLFFIACSPQRFTVSEIKQGKWQECSQTESDTNYYLDCFALEKNKKHGWEVLYSDTATIYFGKVKNKNWFSKTKIISRLYYIPIAKMEKDIPLYREENLDQILTDSIRIYLLLARRCSLSAIKSVNIIRRGDSINYQVEAVSYWIRWEGSMLDWLPFGWGDKIGGKWKQLILTDKNMEVVECFTILEL
jgi:hypothetical protein